MRALDWSQTPLGPPDVWPQSLKTALSILLASGYPMYIAWGPEFIQFYNDAYRPILGATKHPRALGQNTSECFAEIWDFIGPMFRRAITTGEATTLVDQLLGLDRNGYVEECYFTFSYSAIPEERGGYGGVFVTVIETTERVLSERRISTLRELAAVTAQARTTEQAISLIEITLGQNIHDLPFTLLYLLDEAGTEARLMGASGFEEGKTASPLALTLGEEEFWPLSRVKATSKGVLVTDIGKTCGELPGGAWPESPHSAIVLPITKPGQEHLAGFLIAGISARLAFNDAYRGYLDLVAGSVATVISSARAYEMERKRAESLAELDRAKTTFFSNVSHEFRTPLTLILGQIEEILTKPEGSVLSENRAALTVAHRNGLRLLKLVNTLLDFSRIEAGRVRAIYEPTDLGAYTTELASVFRSVVEKAGMRLLVHCRPLSRPIYVDKEMWEKIVLNLLSNAFKFTEAGEIEVRLEETEGGVTLSVRDTGTGIAEEQLPHIFERFHRVEGARARTQEGTGIGLALVQELVKLHEGTIGVESLYGKGSTFTVSLPSGTAHIPREHLQGARTLSSTALEADVYVIEALRWLPDEPQAVAEDLVLPARAAARSSVQEDAGDSGSRRRILLADDNADMREYVSRLLRQRYEVIAVPDGRAALQAVHEHHPDLLLSDVMMPGLNGFELLQALRTDTRTKTLPVILLSARAGEEARVEGLMATADDYLTKPFSAQELLARVASHLEMARVRKEASEEKERLLAQLEVERARLIRLFQLAPAFIAVLRGPEHVFEMANPACCQLVGHRNILGMPVREALPEIQGQGFFELLDEVYRTGQPYSGRNMRVLLQSEECAALQERYVDFIYQPLLEVDGTVSGILVHGVDLTERRHAEQEIKALNARLRRAVTETHHRVKNNLQLISALIDLQSRSGRETVPMSELVRLGQNIQALGVIHDILTRESSKDGDAVLVPVKGVFEKLLPILQATSGERRILSALDDVLLPGKQATSMALVANELISNAVKHGKGDIELILQVRENTATLEVCDDGPGFDEGFDPRTAAHTGLELIENITRYDLHAETAYLNRPQGGARVVIIFPV